MSRICGWCLGVALATGSTVSAQDLAEKSYAQGVHQYFAGLSWDAYNSFSLALGAGSRDPRCFYFRGLASHRLGRTYEAQADFDTGAALETGPSAGQYPIDRSLERVQGYARMQLEQRRVLARRYAATQQPIAPGAEVVAKPQPVAAPVVEVGTVVDPFIERDPFGDLPGKVVKKDAGAAGELPVAPATAPAAPMPETAPPPAKPVVAAPAAPAAPAVQDGSGKGGAAAFGGMLGKVLGGLVPKVNVPVPPGLPGISPTDPPAPQAPPPAKP